MKRTISFVTAALLLAALLPGYALVAAAHAQPSNLSEMQAVTAPLSPAELRAVNGALLEEAGARSLAFEQAGVAEADVKHLRTERDTEDGAAVYEVKFTVPASSAAYEYHFRISDSALLKAEYDYRGTPSTGGATLHEADAKRQALQLAGVAEEDVTYTRCKLEKDDGVLLYELKFYTSAARYEYELAAADGMLLHSKYTLCATPAANSATDGSASPTTLNLSADTARQIALEQVPGATVSDIRTCTLESDDGQLVYEIELVYNHMEYECKLSAATGQLLEWESESVFDD